MHRAVPQEDSAVPYHTTERLFKRLHVAEAVAMNSATVVGGTKKRQAHRNDRPNYHWG